MSFRKDYRSAADGIIRQTSYYTHCANEISAAFQGLLVVAKRSPIRWRLTLHSQLKMRDCRRPVATSAVVEQTITTSANRYFTKNSPCIEAQNYFSWRELSGGPK